MSLLQRRQPAGQPTGGQFAAAARGEPTTTLTWAPQAPAAAEPARLSLGEFADHTGGAPGSGAGYALRTMVDLVLDRNGVPRPPRVNGQITRVREAVANALSTDRLTPRTRAVVLGAVAKADVAAQADRLARMTGGHYEINVVNYLADLGREDLSR